MSPRSMRLASSTSCAAFSSGWRPASRKKSCSASVVVSCATAGGGGGGGGAASFVSSITSILSWSRGLFDVVFVDVGGVLYELQLWLEDRLGERIWKRPL